jgi:hypothetical protein
MSGFEDNGSIKALQNDINNSISGLDSGLDSQLQALANKLESQLKSGNFKDRTGNLRRSIRVTVIDNDIKIDMADYGYFLSFGVKGKKNSSVLGLAPEVAAAFGVSEGSTFGDSNVYGISARKFYPLDFEEQLLNILTKDI